LEEGATVAVASGGEQWRLGFHAERLSHARQQHMADHFGAGRAAGFAREHHADAKRPKLIREQDRMCRLAGSFAALERYEASTHLATLCRTCQIAQPFIP